MEDILKVVKSLEESGLFIKSISETSKNEVKKTKGGFFNMLLVILSASLLENLLTHKGVKAKIPERGVIRIGEGTIRTGQDF